jgi:hypothetical protein
MSDNKRVVVFQRRIPPDRFYLFMDLSTHFPNIQFVIVSFMEANQYGPESYRNSKLLSY